MDIRPSIDLTVINGFSLYGYVYGKQVRHKFDLDSIDKNNVGCIIKCNHELLVISSTFIFGLFEESILHFKTKFAFLSHYEIEYNDIISRNLERCIRRILDNPDWKSYSSI